MKLASIAGLALFMLTSLVVGLRVLGLWRSTRKQPELLLATALLCTGFLAYAVGTAGKLWASASLSVRAALTLTGLSVECIGIVSLVAFAHLVFHPNSRAARVVALAIGAAIALALVGEISTGEYLRYSDPEPISGPWVPLGLLARGAGPSWMAFECFRYHAKLRRQRALGLASALVVHRVLLWGVGIGASALGYAVSFAHRLAFGTGLRAHAWALTLVSFLALVAAGCIGVAFFPPKRYRRWAEGR